MNERIVVDGSGRPARHASGSQETGFRAEGAQYYVWQEDLAAAEAWAVSLAPLDIAPASDP